MLQAATEVILYELSGRRADEKGRGYEAIERYVSRQLHCGLLTYILSDASPTSEDKRS